MTPERLKEIEKLAEGATRETWYTEPNSWSPENIYARGKKIAQAIGDSGQTELDAAFIAASREVVPELIAEVKRLRKMLGTLLNIEIKGHTIADRLQFSDIGRSILQERDALGGEG